MDVLPIANTDVCTHVYPRTKYILKIKTLNCQRNGKLHVYHNRTNIFRIFPQLLGSYLIRSKLEQVLKSSHFFISCYNNNLEVFLTLIRMRKKRIEPGRIRICIFSGYMPRCLTIRPSSTHWQPQNSLPLSNYGSIATGGAVVTILIFRFLISLIKY